MMKQAIKLICLFLLTATQISCVEKAKNSSNTANDTNQTIGTPKASRDTIVKQVIIVDTVRQEIVQTPVQQTAKPQQTTSQSRVYEEPRRTTSSSSTDGFFDGYKENFQGDPNKDLKPIVKVVVDESEIEKKKKLEEAIKKLEEKNKEQQAIKDKINQGIEEYNKQVEEENKAKDAQQTEQKKGKTLDTDLLLK